MKRGIPTAQLVREIVDKGLCVEGYSADISFIRTQLREELTAVLMPQINRLIKIVVKTGLMSVASFYLLTEVIADFVPSARRKSLEEVTEKSKKKAEIYLKIRDNLMDEVIQSFYTYDE